MKKVILFFLSLFLILSPKQICQGESWPIVINQLMIGQTGQAKNEFIELYNHNDQAINLKDYSLKKMTSSGSESNLISAKNFIGIIPAKGYFLIASPEFCSAINCDLAYSTSASLAKNNALILYNQEKELSDSLAYGQVDKFIGEIAPNLETDEVLQRNNFPWEGQRSKDVFNLEKSKAEIRNSRGKIIKIPLSSNSQKKSSEDKNQKSKPNKEYHRASLKDLRSLNNGDLVQVAGIVSAVLGVLASQYFYIHQKDENDGQIYGIQIYNYNKNFPELKKGDYLEAQGELTITDKTKVYKVKTKEEQDIKIVNSEQRMEIPPVEKISHLKESHTDTLKTVEGEISQNKSKQIYLDDGEEILIEIKAGTGIPSKTLEEGKNFIISGIFNYNDGKKKITPLEIADISGEEINLPPLGEILDEEFWEIEKNEERKNILKYLGLSILAGIIFLFFHKKL